MNHRILFFGGNGQVGQAFQDRPMPPNWTVKAVTSAECDFRNQGSIAKTVHDFAPDIVINSAAMSHIDDCEKDQDKAIAINFHAVATLAAQCDIISAPLIQISTDYVFDGSDGKAPYHPDDAMSPLNIYGGTKMMGEEAARSLPWHVIVRTSLIFSQYGRNTLVKTLEQIETQDEVQAACDVRANPTSAGYLAHGIISMADAILNGKGNGFGTFHISGQPALTRYEFLQAIMDAYAPFTTRHPRLVPVITAGMPDVVPRPANSALNNDKVCEVYGIQPRLWQDDLVSAIRALKG